MFNFLVITNVALPTSGKCDDRGFFARQSPVRQPINAAAIPSGTVAVALRSRLLNW